MKRSRLRNKYLKSKSLTDRKKYNVQRNFCKKLLRTTKKEYFKNLEAKMSLIIELSGEVLFLFFEIKIQKVIKLS